MQKLGRNQGGYFGETIDIQAVVNACTESAVTHGWTLEFLPTTQDLQLCALHRLSTPVARNIYISTGIHGDEPAGPLALRRLIAEDLLPRQFNYWACPCLNPTGFPLNRRENVHGVDLNRDYLEPQSAEVRTHVEWLKRQPAFDVCFCLHEDWESLGFYVYELNPDQRPSLAEAMVAAVEPVCPIDRSSLIEGREASGGIIRPSADPRTRPQWPEAFHLFQHKTRQSYTLEAPSDFALPVRVEALVQAMTAALGHYKQLQA